jgi:NAD-dependent deacetylase
LPMTDTQELIEKAANIILNSSPVIALTGAGISVESGIPDFRGKGGLWYRYNPDEYATINAFISEPEKVWKMLREMDELILKAKPNRAHTGLAQLEKMGLLQYIITQNVDNLHQAGGSENVIEYHGNSTTLLCLYCNSRYSRDEFEGQTVPVCGCGKILKPDVVFFGEAIPQEALEQSFQLASSAHALLVVGTSATVSPANYIPTMAKKNDATIIEINLERTFLTDSITDIFIKGEAGDVMSRMVELISTWI